MNKYLQSYKVAVQYPNVSGFEHLDMLMTRDKLAEQSLTSSERFELAQADQALLNAVNEFYEALKSITDLQQERKMRERSPDHWWWYLDVLAQLPSQPQANQPTHFQPA